MTWIFLVAPELPSISSNALITFLLHMDSNLPKNLFKSCMPLILKIRGDSVPSILTMDITLPAYLFFSSGLLWSNLVCSSSLCHMVFPIKLNSSLFYWPSMFVLMPMTICLTTMARVSSTANLYYLFWWPINPDSVLNTDNAFFIMKGWNSDDCALISYRAAVDASNVAFNGIIMAFV